MTVKTVAMVARREIKKLAEAKRAIVTNEGWMNNATGAGFTGIQSWVVNALSFLTVGTDDNQYLGNEIIDPLLVFKGAVRVQWLDFLGLMGGILPTVQITVTLFAANDDTAIVVPRSVTTGEESAIWIRYPDNNQRGVMNTQNITVIKRKTLVLRPTRSNPAGGTTGSPTEIYSFKITKRLRGKKEFETVASPVGQPDPSNTTVLKGYNYYWHVSKIHSSPFVSATTNQPVQIFGDRYVYYKDP